MSHGYDSFVSDRAEGPVIWNTPFYLSRRKWTVHFYRELLLSGLRGSSNWRFPSWFWAVLNQGSEGNLQIGPVCLDSRINLPLLLFSIDLTQTIRPKFDPLNQSKTIFILEGCKNNIELSHQAPISIVLCSTFFIETSLRPRFTLTQPLYSDPSHKPANHKGPVVSGPSAIFVTGVKGQVSPNS